MQNDHDTNTDTDIDFAAAIDRLDTLNAQIRLHETRVRRLSLYNVMTLVPALSTAAAAATTLQVYNTAKDTDVVTPAVPAFGSVTLVFAFMAAVLFAKRQGLHTAVKNGTAQYQQNLNEKAALLDVPVETFKPMTPRR
ncbi:hypothetical protein [Micavibrio aeruginosavorus]|uniref:hypothetical protein n=1 Tax=Micavibrio aeruginosavorus TaxID=349221 RepID=UPI003F4ABE03